jgi:hypothetical protein
MWPWNFQKEVLAKLQTLTEAVDGLANDVRGLTNINKKMAQQVDAIFNKLGLKVSDLDIVIKNKGNDPVQS